MINWDKILQEKHFPSLKEMLNYYYTNRGLSAVAVSGLLGCSPYTIKGLLKQFGIKTRNQQTFKINWEKVAFSSAFTSITRALRTLYLKDQMSIAEIAKQFSVSTTSVRYKLIELKIPRRSPGLGRYWARTRDEAMEGGELTQKL